MKTDNQQTVEQFWAHELGLDSGMLPTTSRVVCKVQHLYPGLQLFRCGSRLIIASPPAKADLVQSVVQGRSPAEVFSVEWVHSVFGQEATAILGPAEVNYADSATFRFKHYDAARTLSTADSDAYHSLASALDPTEVADSGFSADAFPAFGAFSDGVLCAVASYEIWKPSIAHITVATDPNYRRRGFAKAAVQALADDAFGQGLILQWRAVAWNKNSLALGDDLGFEHYCSTIYVRFQGAQ